MKLASAHVPVAAVCYTAWTPVDQGHSHSFCRSVSTDELQRVMHEVDEEEASGCIESLSDEDTHTSILASEPEAGQVISRREYPVFGATELTLSNGMRVCRPSKDFCLYLLNADWFSILTPLLGCRASLIVPPFAMPKSPSARYRSPSVCSSL